MEDNKSSDNLFAKINELSVPILKSVEKSEIDNFRPYYLRYYEDKYCTAFNESQSINNDVLLRFHSNRLILITLAKGHDIFRNQKTIESINFKVNGKNMNEITLSGKKKFGAKKLKPESVLCYLKCTDDEKEYPIYSCIPASLIEINPHVQKNPQLLVTDYKKLGYIGVLYPQCYGPKSMSVDAMVKKHNLLSETEYEKCILLSQEPQN